MYLYVLMQKLLDIVILSILQGLLIEENICFIIDFTCSTN